MSAGSSLTAPSGKRLWAGMFDALTVVVLFLAVAGIGEGAGFDLKFWWVFSAIFFLYHFIPLLTREGRTLGKTAIEIAVVADSGRPLNAAQCLARALYRTLPFLALSFPGGELVGAALLLAIAFEVHLLQQPPLRQTVADRVAKTLVVNLPPLQPHRAPAIPMYSAGDAEFGAPPRKPKDGNSSWTRRSCG